MAAAVQHPAMGCVPRAWWSHAFVLCSLPAVVSQMLCRHLIHSSCRIWSLAGLARGVLLSAYLGRPFTAQPADAMQPGAPAALCGPLAAALQVTVEITSGLPPPGDDVPEKPTSMK